MAMSDGRRAIVRFTAAFALVLVGALAAFSVGLDLAGACVALAGVGVVAGIGAGRLEGLAGAIAAVVAAYPLALRIGAFAFLGDEWGVAAFVLLAATALGFAAGTLATIVVRRRRSTKWDLRV
jgi:hypothetical protein